jgi:hypothetical protein
MKSKSPKMLVTGKKPKFTEISQILGEKKYSILDKYSSKEDYKKVLLGMNHIELCDELRRLNEAPSVSKEICLERCLKAYENHSRSRKVTNPNLSNIITIDDILSGRVKNKKK